jgi:hypothetical protein
MAAILFLQIVQISNGRDMPRLFYKKIVIKNIFFIIKRSRLVVITTIWKPDTKSVRKMTISNPDGPVFGGSLYFFR